MTEPKPTPPRLLHAAEMPCMEGLRIPDDLYVVCRAPALLAGLPRTSITPARLSALHDAGYRHIVRLEQDGPEYDPHPLNLAGNFGLRDLCGERVPAHPEREIELVSAAVRVVLGALASGEGVLVHCIGGRGRTGTVIGAALVSLGHRPEAVAQYLDAIHRQRHKSGWPESPWQADALHAFVRGGAR